MSTQTWDYTRLASSYVQRPPYAGEAVTQIVTATGLPAPRAADIGAGTGHLTVPLAERGCTVDAVEPNDAMRTIGEARTTGTAGIRWYSATGEETGLESGVYDLVTFGSSFNTTDRPAALTETARIGRSEGWFACLWNHRNLEDPLQARIEEVIRARVPGYSYGTRREDQSSTIEASGLFGPIHRLEEPVRHRVSVDDWLVAWRSHATLQYQAGDAFNAVIRDIEDAVRSQNHEEIEVPYTTVGWFAQLRRS